MSANVESMMFAGETPWHKLGTYVGDKNVTSEEALKLSGLDWKVGLRPVFADISRANNGTQYELADEHRAVVRETDGRVLGIVGTRYAPLQNVDAFKFMDSLVQGKHAMYHTAGSLCGGKKVWMLAKLPDVVKVKGKDITEKYLLLTNQHNGDGAARVFFTPVRVVCANTLGMALKGFTRHEGYSIRHTGDIEQKIKAAQQVLGLAQKYYKEFEVKANWLADQRFNDTMMAIALRKIFPAQNENEIPTRTQNIRNKVVALFQGEGKGSVEFRGTAWGAVQAFSEFADHHKTVRGENEDLGARLDSLWFGSGAALKHRAFDVVDAIVEAAG